MASLRQSEAVIKTGLLGGSFNPAHSAHRAISLFAVKTLGLDEVWWLVSPGNPLKPDAGMAPLAARLFSAQAMARRAPIRPTAIEAEIGTRYTADTLGELVRLYPGRRFVWLMGADNLAQFHLWKDWREIARTMPIAVISRPGYSDRARTAPAMTWLRRYLHPAGKARHWSHWEPPAVTLLRFRPDASSATALRDQDPQWHRRFPPSAIRDPVTRRRIV